MDTAPINELHGLQSQILDRRARLQAVASTISAAYVQDLLAEIDSALRRFDTGCYGYCETCRDPIEAETLRANPLARFCLDHLTQAERKAHEQDLELATQIQSRLLPPRDLTLENWDTHYRYQPVGAVGGDYCELILLDQGRSLFFAVGDVAGKGVAASLLMTHLSAIFRSLLSLDLPLAEIMSRANRLFCDSTTAAHYATLVCGRATADGVELCDAGHCPPFFLRHQQTQRMESTGLPLGMFCGTEYAVRRLTFDVGESLVLYSDGISEARDSEGDEYGEHRVLASARRHFAQGAEAMAEGILCDVASFRDHCPPTDDVTVLIVRRCC